MSPASLAAVSWRGKYRAQAPLDSAALKSKHCLLALQAGVRIQRNTTCSHGPGVMLDVLSWGCSWEMAEEGTDHPLTGARALGVLDNVFPLHPWMSI